MLRKVGQATFFLSIRNQYHMIIGADLAGPIAEWSNTLHSDCVLSIVTAHGEESNFYLDACEKVAIACYQYVSLGFAQGRVTGY